MFALLHSLAMFAAMGAFAKSWRRVHREYAARPKAHSQRSSAGSAPAGPHRFAAGLPEGEISSVKIFLRTDIWERITEEGLREATHISRDIHIEWNKASLQNLIVRRLLNNPELV